MKYNVELTDYEVLELTRGRLKNLQSSLGLHSDNETSKQLYDETLVVLKMWVAVIKQRNKPKKS